MGQSASSSNVPHKRSESKDAEPVKQQEVLWVESPPKTWKQRGQEFLINQFVSLNIPNIALLITILALSQQINNTLRDQQAQNAVAQSLLFQANSQSTQLQSSLQAAKDTVDSVTALLNDTAGLRPRVDSVNSTVTTLFAVAQFAQESLFSLQQNLTGLESTFQSLALNFSLSQPASLLNQLYDLNNRTSNTSVTVSQLSDAVASQRSIVNSNITSLQTSLTLQVSQLSSNITAVNLNILDVVPRVQALEAEVTAKNATAGSITLSNLAFSMTQNVATRASIHPDTFGTGIRLINAGVISPLLTFVNPNAAPIDYANSNSFASAYGFLCPPGKFCVLGMDVILNPCNSLVVVTLQVGLGNSSAPLFYADNTSGNFLTYHKSFMFDSSQVYNIGVQLSAGTCTLDFSFVSSTLVFG